MIPSEFMQKYRSMVVRLDDATLVTADVHQYMINTSTNVRVADAQAMWAKISAKMNEQVKEDKKKDTDWQKAGNIGPLPARSREWIISQIDPSVTGSLLAAVQYGKGSPA